MENKFLLSFLAIAVLFVTINVVPNLNSTLNDNIITINAVYPDSNLKQTDYFSIRGDSCSLNWTQGSKLTQISSNNWSIQVTCPSTITQFEFKILKSESSWTVGPNFVIDLTQGQSTYTVYPFFTPGAGTYQITKLIHSKKLNNYRSMIVYMPASYKENTLKVYDNLLIMHDGQNLFDPKTAFMGQAWMVQDTVDNLIAQGSIEDMVIAGIYNTADRMEEYTYSFDAEEGFGGKGDVYLDFLQSDIIPLILSQYRINQNLPKGVSLIGSSLGGLISCYAGWTRSNLFKQVGCMSSSFWWNNEDFQNTIITQKNANFDNGLQIYLDSGDQGDSQDDKTQTLGVLTYLQKKWLMKIDQNLFYYLDQGASHSEYYWGKRFSKPCLALFTKEPLA